MRSKRNLAALQARAKSATGRLAQNRVVVTREVSTADDGTQVAARSAELWLYGTVGGYWWGFDSDDVAQELRALGDVDELLVRLHSFGGSAIEGIAIANLLANLPAGVHVRIVVDGVAASAASMIALAGAELIMSPGSQLMVHDAWMVTAGNEAELHAEAEWIGKQSRNYAETYAHRAGGTADSWRDIMRANNGDGTWYSAQEAVDAGLATRVDNIASTTTPPPMPDPTELDDDIELAAAAEWDLEVLLHPAARAAMSSWRLGDAPKPPTASAGGSNNTQGTETAVTFTDQQLTTMRDKLGLSETADEGAILAAVEAVVDESLEDRPAQDTIPEGSVVISSAELDTLRAGATAGTAAAQTLHERDREAFLNDNKAKYPVALKDAWSKQYDLDPDAARKSLAAMPDLIPTTELGHASEGASEGEATSLDDVRNSDTYKNWSM